MQNRILSIKYFEKSHSGEEIANVLEEAFNDLEISSKIHVLVTDNAGNMTKTYEELKKKEGFQHIEHLGCTVHKIQLCVVDILRGRKEKNEKKKKEDQPAKKTRTSKPLGIMTQMKRKRGEKAELEKDESNPLTHTSIMPLIDLTVIDKKDSELNLVNF